MFNRTKKNEDNNLSQDVNQLADTLDDLLKSYGSKTRGEADEARSRAETMLKETRARLQSQRGRLTQAAKDTGDQVDTWIHDRPWHGVGIGTAIGIVLGALLVSTSSRN